MVQLKILSGKKAGTELVARHFPFLAGRSATCQLLLDEPGVWEKHFQINLNPAKEFVLEAQSNTAVTIGGKSLQQTVLRNGDVIEFGAAKVLFGFCPTAQKSLWCREWLTWLALVGLGVVQIVLIYGLLR